MRQCGLSRFSPSGASAEAASGGVFAKQSEVVCLIGNEPCPSSIHVQMVAMIANTFTSDAESDLHLKLQKIWGATAELSLLTHAFSAALGFHGICEDSARRVLVVSWGKTERASA